MSLKALEIISEATAALGYRKEAVRRNYRYSDVWDTEPDTRSVAFAAFTQTPPSYRSAAFAAVFAEEREHSEVVHEHRALGAPLLFVIDKFNVTTWQVYAKGPPRLLEQTSLDNLLEYFEDHSSIWAPDVIHRAKSIGRVEKSYQLDFVDVGLISAIEGEIHKKLDRLLREALAEASVSNDTNLRYLFRGVFRLLAAKILMDRQHTLAGYWDNATVETVLSEIGNYYGLGQEQSSWPRRVIKDLQPVWHSLCRGLNVANISADDLASVYEHTLVTPRARKEFGTHSTPRHVADYIVSRLRLWEYGDNPPKICEPFTGAGVFLVSALRYLKDGLPHKWGDKRRHDLLVKRIKGAEIDPFGCEVAKLSLILADYPNANGWVVDEANLFVGNALATRVRDADIILCNPPFESFTDRERRAWPEAASLTPSKAIFALETAIRARPSGLGFVVPRALLVDRRYREQRIALEKNYSEIEFVSLPDGVFNVSQADTALLIARDVKGRKDEQLLRSTEVFDGEKKKFAQTGVPSRTRELSRSRPVEPSGSVWLPPLSGIWQSLASLPRLGDYLEGHWGVRWKSHQKLRSRTTPKPGWSRGILNTFSHRQYALGGVSWLDTRPSEVYGALDLPWNEPKILCNAGRLSRKYWRLAAAVDRDGLIASQQFIALWPRGGDSVDLDALAALINGALINAYMAEHSFDKRFRIKTLLNAPLPRTIPAELGELSRKYTAEAHKASPSDGRLRAILSKIDELVLSAYNLSPHSEQELLSVFQGSERPTIGERGVNDLTELSDKSRGRIQNREGGRLMFEYFGSVERSIGSDIGKWVGVRQGTELLSDYSRSISTENWAGEVVGWPDLSRVLAVGSGRLQKWRQEGALISFADTAGRRVYPVEQFYESRPIEGLRDALGVIKDARIAWLWMRQPHEALSGLMPLELLRQGEIRKVTEVATRDFS